MRALIVFGGNPVLSTPGAARVRTAFDSLEMLAVLDTADTATTQPATHIIPVASQLERVDLTAATMVLPVVFRRYTPAVVARVGDTLPMWRVFDELRSLMQRDGGDEEDEEDVRILRPVLAGGGGGVNLDELRNSPSGIVTGGPELGLGRAADPARGTVGRCAAGAR